MGEAKKMDCQRRVLFVDDEASILRSLQREFFDSEYGVLVARSAAEALGILETETVDLLVTDYKMPEMDGLQLLALVKERHPTISRVILSGYVEQTEVFRALVKGLATVYFAKPWQSEALRERIRHIFQIRDFLRTQAVSRDISAIDRIPMLPRIYQDFLSAVNDNASLKEIAMLIEGDMALAARILHVTNSAFYGGQKNASLERAVMILGLNAVKDIVLTVSLAAQMDLGEMPKRWLEEIFVHSSMVNRLMRRLYPLKLKTTIPEAYASVGVTHDIGKLILLQSFQERYRQITDYQAAHPQLDFYECECELGFAGCSHSELGAYFLDLWNLPETLVEVALFHHRPKDGASTYREILELTHLADSFVNLIGATPEGKPIDPVRLPGDFLDPGQVAQLGEEIRREFHDLN